MKKALFVYDGPLVRDQNGIYYGTALNNDVFKRYEYIADVVSIAIRVKFGNLEEVNKLSKIDTDKYKIYELPSIHSIKGMLFNKKHCYKKLSQYIENSDLVIIRMHSFIGNIAAEICRKKHKNYIIELVSCPWDCLWNHSLRGKLTAPFMFFKTKKEIKKAPNVCYVSEKFLQSRYPTSGNSLACSDVVIKNQDNNILEKRIDKIKKMNKKRFVIGTIAPVDIKYKGQRYVVKALAILKNKGYDITYNLIGGGSEESLRKIARKYNVESHLKFLGNVKHDNIFKALDDIDIYIQPSNAESHGRVIIEAMSRGCPCIGSSTGGIPELVDNKYVFKRKNACDLAEKIEKIIHSNIENQAINNYKKSQEFLPLKLSEKRNKFYTKFIKTKE